MRTYTITKVNGKIDWERVGTLAIDNLLWTESCDIAAWAKIAYDAENLYVRLWAKEREIRAEHTSQTGMPCEDSCLEFFFAPAADDTRYMNFEFNPNGASWIGIAYGRDDAVRLLPDLSIFDPKPIRTEDGWQITYRIPLSFVRLFVPQTTFASGVKIRANCYKCGDLTVLPHYLSWNRVGHETPEFHSYPYFGEMIFE